MPSFYNGKRFFLTYPRCDSTPHELVAFLAEKGAVKRYVVSREKHKDGTPHLHACVEYVSTQRQPVDWLDFRGKHPNKQDPRKWIACITYVKKDGDFIESEEVEDLQAQRDLLGALCGKTKLEWLQFCVDKRISYQYAMAFWSEVNCDIATITTSDPPGKMCPALEAFQFVNELHRTIIIQGESGCGKTTWALKNVPKPSLFVSHIDQLKTFKPGEHKSIIFDDVSFSHYPVTTQIAIVDFDNARAIHCRHSVAMIPAGVFKVFTCNDMPLSIGEPAIKRRVKVFRIKV